MKTYCVRMGYDCYADYTGEADNEEEAMKKAEQMKRMIRSRSWKEWQESLVVNFREYEVYEE